MMRHGSLFSGIGGFDLAATWMKWENVFHCERDPFCRKVLHHYWPQTASYGDIFQFDATQYRGHVDIISGGFPCQPFSHAGKRKGKKDDRYLWPETRRIIMEARPKWIVLENVAGLFTILEPESLSEVESKEIELFCADEGRPPNTIISRLQRRVIGSIITEIGSAGYLLPRLEDGTPIVLCIPACAVDAPHRRDRVWFVASHADGAGDFADFYRSGYAGSDRADDGGRDTPSTFNQGCPDPAGSSAWVNSNGKGDGQQSGYGTDEIFADKGREHAFHDVGPVDGITTHSDSAGLEGRNRPGAGESAWYGKIPDWHEWPAQPAVCGRDDGISGRLDGITFPKWRTESIKAYGNAIVPQLAFKLFESIALTEKQGVN